jgi:glycosyltransferase involved in cell wall biosynthesis
MTFVPPSSTDLAFLQANSDAYEWLISKIDSLGAMNDREAVLRQVVSTAHFAGVCHPGRFADGSIENIGLQIGSSLTSGRSGAPHLPQSSVRENSRRRILHVAGFVVGVGGHSRMLYHWLRNDRSSCHSVVLSDQIEPIPHWFSEAVQAGGGDLLQLPPSLPLCERSSQLIALARQNVDLVVLHHGWCDVVPTVAFSSDDCPPVAVLNHADHVFWLGSSVADMVINLRSAGADHTAKRRFVSCNTVLPIPLLDQPRKVSRRDARSALGIPENQIVLLSVGRPEKYRPCGSFDFVATAGKILDRERNAHLYVVGESAAGIAPFLRSEVHERLHFVGSLDDPSPYRDAADVYLESFPFGSTTALLEAALNGLPVVPAYAPLFPLLVASADSIGDLLPNPGSEQEYIERVMFLIAQPDQRAELGQTLRNRMLVDHVGEGWLTRLDSLYNETDHLTHAPRPIPESCCLFTAEDIGLSMWNVFSDGKTNYRRGLEDQRSTAFLHSSFVARQVGNFAKARGFAWRAVRENPFRIDSWRLLGKAMLGQKGPLIRRVLRHLRGRTIKVFT